VIKKAEIKKNNSANNRSPDFIFFIIIFSYNLVLRG